MSALDLVRGGGRSLDRRLARVSGEALLAGLRAAGAVSEPEVAALGRPDGGGWTRRLRALAAAKGDRTCRVLLSVLEGLEGPPRPGPFDFFDPQRDAAPGHRSDCPCCRPEPEWTLPGQEEGGPKTGEEGPEDDEGEAKNEEGNPEDEEGEAKNGDEGPEDDEGGGDEGPGDEDGGNEGPEDEEDGGDEGPEDEDEDGGDEGPEDEDEGDEGPEDEEGGDEGPGDDEGGGDEGPGDDDDGGGGGDED